MQRSRVLLVLAPLALACGSGCGGSSESDVPGRATSSTRPAPGEEPLETESIGDEEVTGLPPERLLATPPSERPCAWSTAWSDPDAPKPLVGGVGDVPNPVRRSEEPIRLPAREPLPRGDIVVEFVIGPDGKVAEARVIRSTEPPWPEAERAVEEAIRRWRYEPPELAGTPIAICSTAIVSP